MLASLGMSGVFSTVGGTYHAGRDTLFMIDWSSDVIREVNPATGAVLATFPVAPAGSPAFDIFYGDLDVDLATGNLLLVSSSQRVSACSPRPAGSSATWTCPRSASAARPASPWTTATVTSG